MATQVIMPQLGESVVEGTVRQWLKPEGSPIREFEPLLEVSTDKVDSEIPAPATGTLLKILVPAGTTVTAGTVLAMIGTVAEMDPMASASARPGAAEPPAALRRELGFISPVVAKIAAEHQLDLQQIPGTGQGGRITKQDVLQFIAQHPEARPTAAPTAPAVPAWEQIGDGDLFRPTELQFQAAIPASPAPAISAAPAQGQPVTGLRKQIAEHMVRSVRTAPHVTTVMEADLSAVLTHRAAHQAVWAQEGVRLTLSAYFAAAAVAALQAVPLVNSQWVEEAEQARIVTKREIHLGLAVALDEGLIVPVIKNAQDKSLRGLARDVTDLAERARTRTLKPDEAAGGTFTITNHGVSGSLWATPIIHQPQTGILGVGLVQKRVVVVGDAIGIRPMVYISLTFDHRVLDGALGDQFLRVVKETLERWV